MYHPNSSPEPFLGGPGCVYVARIVDAPSVAAQQRRPTGILAQQRRPTGILAQQRRPAGILAQQRRPAGNQVPNPQSKIRNGRAFTLIEILVVISIIGIIAGLVVGLAPAAGRAMRISRAKGELNQLLTAIDQYKAVYGHYPPDNVNAQTGIVIPEVNQLYYELSGTLYNTSPPNYNYVSPDGATKLTPTQLNSLFGRKGFVNVSFANNNVPSRNPEDPKKKDFLPNLKPAQIGQLTVNSVGIQVLVVPVDGRNAAGQPIRTNAWRYVSSPDPLKLSSGANYTRHNPNGYDLWAEVLIGNEVKIIGNW